MKLSELNVGTEYAVVPSWKYSSRNSRDLNNVDESDVVKATLVELTKYNYEPSQRRQDPAGFSKASAGERSVGVLVKATDNSGGEFYWTSRLADILAEYATLEPKWATKKAEQEKREREENERRERERLIAEQVQQEVARSRNSILDSAKELLGSSHSVEVNTNGYGADLKGVVTFTLKDFEKLIELAYAGQDNN